VIVAFCGPRGASEQMRAGFIPVIPRRDPRLRGARVPVCHGVRLFPRVQRAAPMLPMVRLQQRRPSMLADIMHVLFDPDQYLVTIHGGEIYLLSVDGDR
jgi:hypothetical protein